MSHENPTPLRVGTAGTLNGWRVRVAGRIVLGVEVDGETYTWNEFHLVDNSGNSATLVFEEGEAGPEWKIFREFTPTQPMAVREAAAKKLGDTVNLDGSAITVTLVDQSEVLFIEGRAPEGVEVGDIANYFNADAGNRMLVASWSGDEIEFYEGLDAPAESVASAFGFALAPNSSAKSQVASFSNRADNNAASSFRGESGQGGSGSSGLFTKIVFVLLGGAGLFGAYSCFSGGGNVSRLVGSSAARATAPAAAPQALQGTSARLVGSTFTVAGNTVVTVIRTTGRHEQREYQLRETGGASALLINGLSGGAQEWHLLRAIPAPKELTPLASATKKKGEKVMIDGRSVTVADLFQAKSASGEPAKAALIQYGFVARDAEKWFLARWTEQQIQFFGGSAIPEAEVRTAFGLPAAKTK